MFVWLPSFKEPKDMKEDINTDSDIIFFLLIYKMLQFCSKVIKFKTTFILIATKLFRKIQLHVYLFFPKQNRHGCRILCNWADQEQDHLRFTVG